MRAPRQLTPAFDDCFDWHSAVHGHCLLARLGRTDPDLANQCRQVLGQSLTEEKLRNEVIYIDHQQRQSFERPYGLS